MNQPFDKIPVKRRAFIVDKVLVYRATGKHIKPKERWRVNFYGIVAAGSTFEQARISCIAQVARVQVERRNWQFKLQQIRENSNRIKV